MENKIIKQLLIESIKQLEQKEVAKKCIDLVKQLESQIYFEAGIGQTHYKRAIKDNLQLIEFLEQSKDKDVEQIKIFTNYLKKQQILLENIEKAFNEFYEKQEENKKS